MKKSESQKEIDIKKILEDRLPEGTEDHIKEIAARYSGDITELERAIGVFYVSHVFGWKVTRMVHKDNNVKRWENILNLSFKDPKYCRPETEVSYKHIVYDFACKIKDYWNVVNFKKQHPDKISRKLVA